MAKGQKKSNCEAKKPKADKKPTASATPFARDMPVKKPVPGANKN